MKLGDRKLQPGVPGHVDHHPIVPASAGDFTPVTPGEHHGDPHRVGGVLAELLAGIGLSEPESRRDSDCTLRMAGDFEAGP